MKNTYLSIGKSVVVGFDDSPYPEICKIVNIENALDSEVLLEVSRENNANDYILITKAVGYSGYCSVDKDDNPELYGILPNDKELIYIKLENLFNNFLLKINDLKFNVLNAKK